MKISRTAFTGIWIPHSTVLTAICIAIFFLAPSCKKGAVQQKDVTTDIVLPSGGAPVMQANAQFAFDFFHANLLTDSIPGNQLISPLSIYMALSMVYNGAAQATKDSMEAALRLRNTSIEDLNQTCLALIQQMPLSDNEVSLSIANSIWYNPSIQPLPGFLDSTKKYYQAAIQPFASNPTTAVNTINAWVSAHTQQKITNIIDQIDPATLMYLINAIYFKGAWQVPFDKNATANGTFTRSDNTTVTTPFMSVQNFGLKYLHNDSLRMVQLPYGGGNFDMYVMMPSDNIPIRDFLKILNLATLQSWESQIGQTRLDVQLPRFSYSYTIPDMIPMLSQMGMGIAFGKKADFSDMYNVPVYVSSAVHKAYIETNEEGTTAAAVTAIGMTATDSPAIYLFKVDHPFVYTIQEKSSGAILFIGMVNDPSAN